MIVSFTGHRPNKLGGYKADNPLQNVIRAKLRQALLEIAPDRAISGMALGVDQWAADACIDLRIPFTAAIPFSGQDSKWSDEAREDYLRLLKAAERVVIVSPGEYAAKKMQIRNQWMVDNSDKLIAVWDGTDGGTANCVRYAERHWKAEFPDPTRFCHIDPRA
jgi:uncharacterized phage-like protein YoqJ